MLDSLADARSIIFRLIIVILLLCNNNEDYSKFKVAADSECVLT